MSAQLTAVIYTRVSRDKAEGRSVDDQERECRKECERQGWLVRKVFCDNSIGASRYSADRPEWRKLKGELRQGDVLVVWESSRAQRDLAEYVLLRDLCAELNVPLSYAGKVLDLTEGDDRFVGGLDALLAERESEQIRTRVLRGKRTSAADGRPMTKPPWGYVAIQEHDAVGRLRPQWIPDPSEAPRVQEAVARLLAGDTQYAVHEWLKTSEGYAPTTPTTLRRALMNPALAGLRVHQGKVTGKASWEPIITEEQHRLLVARSKQMAKIYGFNSQPGPEPKYLLSGIAKCGECGEGLRYRAKAGRKPYYACHKGHVSRLAEMLDSAVESALFYRLAAVNATEYETAPDDSEVLAAIQDLEAQLADWEEKAIAGEVSAAAFGRVEKGLRDRLDMLEASKSPPPALEFDASLWPTLTMSERRQIVRAMLTVVVPRLGKRVRALPGDVAITRI